MSPITYFKKKLISKFLDTVVFTKRKQFLETIPDIHAGNAILDKFLRGQEPFFAGRFGTTEGNCFAWYYTFRKSLKISYPEDIKTSMENNAGFFPAEDADLDRYNLLMEESCSRMNAVGCWGVHNEAETVRKYLRHAEIFPLESLDFFKVAPYWTQHLRGRKVLVIHPFADSIKKQYEQKREAIFPDQEVLPEFKLLVLKSPQTIAGNRDGYGSWFEAYEEMCSKIQELDFDIALIGAGSYGLPLSSYVKGLGKSVIYMGGVLQILFGIRGKRWDQDPVLSKFYNDAWVRPAEHEIPDNSRQVEDGCYW